MKLNQGVQVPCFVVRGLDGKLYLKFSSSEWAQTIAKELNLDLWNVDGFENGIELKEDPHEYN